MILKAINTSDGFAVETSSPVETEALGRRLGGLLFPGACVALVGELGAGKTIITRGIARGLGVDEKAPVTSPSYVIISEYEGRLPLHHVDAYRLRGPGDIVDLGSRELFFGRAVSVVEWADRIAGALPEERLDIEIMVAGTNERTVTFRARGAEYSKLSSDLRASFD